jgi:hypothetical protein
LCLITYSVQYTASSIGVRGRSLKIRERRWAFSRYLWWPQNSIYWKWKNISCSQSNQSLLLLNSSSYNFKHFFITNVNTCTHTST